VCRLARENTCGYKRISGELRKLGIALPKSCVPVFLRRNGLPPSPERQGLTWREFLARHADVLLCADLFTKEIWAFCGLHRHAMDVAPVAAHLLPVVGRGELDLALVVVARGQKQRLRLGAVELDAQLLARRRSPFGVVQLLGAGALLVVGRAEAFAGPWLGLAAPALSSC
jgi:hypothetical protein